MASIVTDMTRQSRYDLANLALGGTLARILAEARARNDSYNDIAYSLRDQGIVVSGETVRQWCLSPHPTEAAS